MEKSFLFVDVTNPTWLVYVGLLVFAVFFRFTRILAVRNLDLTLLLLLSTALVVTDRYRNAPVPKADDAATSATADDIRANLSGSANDPNNGVAAVEVSTSKVNADARDRDKSVAAEPSTSVSATDAEPSMTQETAVHPVYLWSSLTLLGLTLFLLMRLVFDESLTRRPRLDQNLNQAGLTFLCIPAFAIPMLGVFMNPPPDHNIKALEHGRALLERREVNEDPVEGTQQQPAPTETLIAAGGTAMAQLSGNLDKVVGTTDSGPTAVERWLARILIVIAHTMVVLGLLHIGRHHFASLQLGLSMSCLYLLLPCTAVKVHELNQVLPAACLIWAISSYRNPIVSGILLGLASGTLFFAAFLLPLWAVFYGRKGGLRFVISVMGVTAVLISCLLLTSGDANSFFTKLVTTANWTVYRLLDDTAAGADASLSQLFVRIPMAAVFFVMLTAMTVLPRPRNLENLLANSTSLIVAAQMWYPDDIGTYVLWYVPLFLLVIFRPRLDRFTPPEAVERQSATVVTPVTAGASSTVAMSRLSFFR